MGKLLKGQIIMELKHKGNRKTVINDFLPKPSLYLIPHYRHALTNLSIIIP